MTTRAFRKWCSTCRKMVDVSGAEEKCPKCGTIIPIPPHEKFGYAAGPPGGPPHGPPPGGPPPGGPPHGPPPGPPPGGPPPGPTLEDIVEILERIEKKLNELKK